ncbi:S41 family peptidase [candidate division CSSED10-310 bacterium]|uniref:S41 family peptidase n=1 Tax=candidate division CSSED10-310 bacterium TaxID=2855610 RepID=A0ABV6Z3R1_UNCC1
MYKRSLFICSLIFALALLGAGCDNDCTDCDDTGPNTGLSTDLRVAEFEHMVHMVNKYYGPIEWKNELLGVDILGSADDFIAQIEKVKNDLDYFDLLFGFISQFQDGHTGFSIMSSYAAYLAFNVDLYEGKLLIDDIWDPRLNLEIGEELVSMDGESAADLVARLRKYMPGGFGRCSQRWATYLVTIRYQPLYPEVVSGDVDVVVRGLDGTTRTETMTWSTQGMPYESGIYTDYLSSGGINADHNIWHQLQSIELPAQRLEFFTNVGKYGHRAPSFKLPDGFEKRLGKGEDELYSGIYPAGGKMIGFLRIPTMRNDDSYIVFRQEIRALDSMTDGLVIDIMDNPGGSVDWCNHMARHLHRELWPQCLFQVRPTLTMIYDFEEWLNEDYLPPEWQETLEIAIEKLWEAYLSGETLTEPISLDFKCKGEMCNPAVDVLGNPIGYSKPIIILINELSISGGDYFPATMQDSGRAKLVGYRTAGGGGHVVGYSQNLPYTESSYSLTGSLMYRYQAVQPTGYPETHYIENVGVHPDYDYDYQNLDDLLNEGQNYVQFFTEIILAEIGD